MRKSLISLAAFLLLITVAGCAKMGKPDGGWFDETPPRVMASSPMDGSTEANSKKITILFDEYIKVENTSEKVVVSPPQMEVPEIKASGKKIIVELVDSLKPNTTYTIDFSDAITDNNEGNPLGNYTYSFSTGTEIDTMEVAGYVVEAENAEPVKGILVGLYDNMADSVFLTQPMLRVSRTDSRGHFVIKGVKEGAYRVFALQDADGNYMFTQKSEKIAFNHDTVVPTCKPDIKQDTIWTDSLHISNISQTGYTHFLPDDIVLRAFTELQTTRYLVKSERQEPDRMAFYFSYGSENLPVIRGLNFDDTKLWLETNARHDTLTYWITDTTLVNQDTLRMEMRYEITDSLEQLVWRTDTLDMLAKMPYERRMKEQQKTYEKWKKQQERRKKRGQPYEEKLPDTPLDIKTIIPTAVVPNTIITMEFPYPPSRIDTSGIRLYEKEDSTWTERHITLQPMDSTIVSNAGKVQRYYQLTYVGIDGKGWSEGHEYSLEIDSAAIEDVYGHVNIKQKKGMKVKTDNDYTTVSIRLQGCEQQQWVVQMVSGQDKPVAEVVTTNGEAHFLYVAPGTYYLRAYYDQNGNGRWDTGNYAMDLQADPMCYYPEKLELKAKWQWTKTWDPRQVDVKQIKPAAITKQKVDGQKKLKQRNAERARKLGIPYIQKQLQQ